MKILQRLLPQSQKAASDNADYLQVIGAGLPRTGTSSLKAALEILGFGPCHHMSELLNKPDRYTEFLQAYDGDMVDFFTLMKGYGSTVDAPTADFYKEIHQAYPKAKIVLTVRDSHEKWYESFTNTIGPLITDHILIFALYPIRSLRLQCIIARKIQKKWIAEYGGMGPQVHRQHNARVISENKEHDLLVFNVKEGWGPLCKFLEVEVPRDVPFPNVNDTNQIKRFILVAKTMGWCVWIFVGVLVAVAIHFLVRFTT